MSETKKSEIKENDILIDLSETDTKFYKDDNFIQKHAKETFIQLINKFNFSDDNTHVHNTILVNGKRGMGKSSFAQNILQHKFQDNDHKDKKIVSLPIIDPTMIESREHIFLLIVTLIRNEIEQYKKCNSGDIKEDLYKLWFQSLKDLAGGLSMLDGIGKSHLEDDTLWSSPELVLERGLNNTKHGYKLEENFRKYVTESLRVLDKNAFLIVLDDIDTSADRGTVILEVLRKYVTTPQIITMLLGDIELYSTLVRQMQWQKIDSNKILKDYEFNVDGKKEIYLSQIEHLEEQYLVKILKPENRIHLKTIYELMSNIFITPKHPIETTEKKMSTLKSYSDEMIKTLFLTTNYKNFFVQTLYTQPTRSVVQLLKAFDESKHELNDEFITKYHDIFYTTLHNHLHKYNLIKSDQYALMNLLGQYTVLNNDIVLDTNFEFLPEYGESDKNIVAIYLNLLFNNHIKPKEYLSYFIKVGYALVQAPEKESKRFINHISLDSAEPNRRIAQRLLTTFEINSNTVSKQFMNLGNIFVSDFDNTKLAKNDNAAYIVSKVYNPKGGKYSFVSFFNLLGLLADLSFADNDGEIKEILKRARLVRDYRVYNTSASFDTNSDDNQTTEPDKESTISTEIDNSLVQWALKSKDIAPLPTYVLSKIWIRTVYTFIDIESRSENKIKNFAVLFELYIAGFLNAVLIQLELYNGNSKMGEKNPSTSVNEYTKNKNNYSKKDNVYTLYDFLVECPILANPNQYYQELEKIKFTKTNQNKKEDSRGQWGDLTQEKKLELVKELYDNGHTSVKQVTDVLNKKYKNAYQKYIKPIFDNLQK